MREEDQATDTRDLLAQRPRTHRTSSSPCAAKPSPRVQQYQSHRDGNVGHGGTIVEMLRRHCDIPYLLAPSAKVALRVLAGARDHHGAHAKVRKRDNRAVHNSVRALSMAKTLN